MVDKNTNFTFNYLQLKTARIKPILILHLKKLKDTLKQVRVTKKNNIYYIHFFRLYYLPFKINTIFSHH